MARLGGPVWLYRFSVVSTAAPKALQGGAVHASDRQYVFKNLNASPWPTDARDAAQAQDHQRLLGGVRQNRRSHHGGGRPDWPRLRQGRSAAQPHQRRAEGGKDARRGRARSDRGRSTLGSQPCAPPSSTLSAGRTGCRSSRFRVHRPKPERPWCASRPVRSTQATSRISPGPCRHEPVPPRIPGRDYAGVVEEGPAEWLGCARSGAREEATSASHARNARSIPRRSRWRACGASRRGSPSRRGGLPVGVNSPWPPGAAVVEGGGPQGGRAPAADWGRRRRRWRRVSDRPRA